MHEVANPEDFDEQPELGMGYHFGELKKGIGGKLGLIVLNGQYALTSEEIEDFHIMSKLRKLCQSETAPGLSREKVTLSNDIQLFKSSFGHLVSNMRFYETRSKLHASPAFTLSTRSRERFVRFSAFKNDRRVQPNRSLLAGTYVTSIRDSVMVPSGFAAVGRYALPNPAPAIYRFNVTVPKGTAGLVGTVAPAFSQAGGGVEIELTNATPSKSVTTPRPLPEY